MREWSKHAEAVELNEDADSVADCDREELMHDIQVAYKRWRVAQIQFNYAKEQDEIDYAIYMLKAAEIKMSILLRKAKHAQLVEHEMLNFNWLKMGDGV